MPLISLVRQAPMTPCHCGLQHRNTSQRSALRAQLAELQDDVRLGRRRALVEDVDEGAPHGSIRIFTLGCASFAFDRLGRGGHKGERLKWPRILKRATPRTGTSTCC
eukprot:10898301-Alexandrium_andersonii.AAC.1